MIIASPKKCQYRSATVIVTMILRGTFGPNKIVTYNDEGPHESSLIDIFSRTGTTRLQSLIYQIESELMRDGHINVDKSCCRKYSS